MLTVHFSISESVKGIIFKLSSSKLFQYTLDVVMYVRLTPSVLEAFNALPVL